VDIHPMNETKDPSEGPLVGGWFCYAFAPALPFLLSTVILQCLAPSEPLDHIEFLEFSDGAVAYSHLGDLLTYGAAVLLQMSICVGVITVQLGHFRKRSVPARRTASRVMMLAIVLAVVVFMVIWIVKAAPYLLTYNTIRQLALRSPGWPAEFAADGEQGILFGQSRMYYACLVPFLLGVLVVAIVAAVNATVAVPDNRSRADWESAFAERVTQLQNSFQASSLVLVACTVALMLFVQLPGRVLSKSGSEAISRFGFGLTLYWGVVMTLTLFATFALPVMALHKEAIGRHRASDSTQSFRQWLSERGNLSVKQQIANLATMLAPIMVGPVGVLLQSILG
jgi:hypothetical protein